MYIADNLNEKMPLDGPLARVYLHKYEPEDMDHLPESQRPKMIQIWKSHHSFCDGVSITTIPLAMSDEFDKSYFLQPPAPSFLQIVLIKLLSPFCIPAMVRDSFIAPNDMNTFTFKKNREGLSGKMNVITSPNLDLAELKKMSKAKGVTINDVVLSAFMTTLHSMLEEAEQAKPLKERQPLPKSLQVIMPANIRFSFYESREKIKLENKFAAIPLVVPLTSSMETAYE